MSYADLDTDAQVEALLPVAVDGATRLGLEVADIALAHHGYNTTFRVRTAGGDYAVRVLTNSQSTAPGLEAQHAWMRAIDRQTDVVVPRPVTGPDGATIVVVPGGALERDAVVVAASWLAGPDLGAISVERAHELGVVMASLHEHATGWELPAGTALPVFDEPLFGDEDLLAGLDLPADAAAVLDASFRRARDAFAETARHRSIPIHADLHGGNLKWHEGRLAVFDFDDSGIGSPALDLAITTFYLRDDIPGAEAGLREGYLAIRELPSVRPEVFEALVAGRQLLLANALLATSTASLRAEAQRYLSLSVERLRHWLDVGRFTRTPPS